MGLFDTVVLPRPVPCPKCHAAIVEVQTKVFNPRQNTYRVGDPVSDIDDMRIEKEELYCVTGRELTGRFVYLCINFWYPCRRRRLSRRSEGSPR